MNIKSETISIEKIWALRINTWLPIFAFAIPFLLSGPQLITGTIVNTLLFIASAKQFNRKSLYLIAALPSLGAISNGLLFGKFTPFLLFFLPSIWLGNISLMIIFNNLRKSVRFPMYIVFPALFKTIVLYLSALIFVGLNIVPKIFLTSMGIIQLFTAILGGILTMLLFNIVKYQYE